MDYVLIIHAVKDYAAWKKVFDSAAAMRKEAGERSYRVLRYENDADKVVHFSHWASLAHAKAFFESTGSEAYTTTPEGLAKFQHEEADKWGRVIKAAGIEAE